MGSIASPHASSSIADSNANVPEASPGARMKVGVPTLRRTRKWLVSSLGQAYRIRVASAAGSSHSSIVDVLDVLSCRTAVSVPSRAAPSVTCCTVCGRPPTGPNICRRVRASFTGRPTSRDAIAASMTCDQAEPFPPNAPPMNCDITRTCSGGMLNVFAATPRTP